jgi:hypothetical protein
MSSFSAFNSSPMLQINPTANRLTYYFIGYHLTPVVGTYEYIMESIKLCFNINAFDYSDFEIKTYHQQLFPSLPPSTLRV